MIHSLAGGEIKENALYNFALVEIKDNFSPSVSIKLWYLFEAELVTVGDRVIVPLGERNTQKEGVVTRVLKALVKGRTPVPVNQAKYIIKKLT